MQALALSPPLPVSATSSAPDGTAPMLVTTHDVQTVEIPAGLTREFLVHHRVCPARLGANGMLTLLVAPDAFVDAALSDLIALYRTPLQTTEVPWEHVERAIERLMSSHQGVVLESARGAADVDGTADVRDLASQPPVIRYVNLLIREAQVAEASDIHLEAMAGGLAARFRIDGVLQEAPVPPQGLEQAVVSRVKLLAELDIAERRRPQDGRIRAKLDDRELDLRISTVPSVFGESVVLRLLHRGGRPASLRALGMPSDVLRAVEHAASAPHGMVLATGPTGSGKTTTLYAALAERQARTEKIITIEDPVEYQLPGIVQIPVDRQAGMSFPVMLRSVLRQDPDVLLIGEMRDQETAHIAVQSAMTGHIVFSTLHTNDALGAVARLIDLGVPAYLVAATVDLVIAQRLVRQSCARCRGAGCADCRGSGYHGRIGLFECLHIADNMRDAIANGASRSQLRSLATAAGMRFLRDDGQAKAEAGLTTAAEVRRVVQG